VSCPKCGATMTAGQRYERTETIDVLVCWSGCGYETPGYGACCKRSRVLDGLTGACERCGVDLTTDQARRGQRFCSRDCCHLEPNHLVPRVCPVCRAAFSAPSWTVRRGKGRYCTKSCAAVDSNRKRRSAA
jgi:hypothetical protein